MPKFVSAHRRSSTSLRARKCPAVRPTGRSVSPTDLRRFPRRKLEESSPPPVRRGFSLRSPLLPDSCKQRLRLPGKLHPTSLLVQSRQSRSSLLSSLLVQSRQSRSSLLSSLLVQSRQSRSNPHRCSPHGRRQQTRSIGQSHSALRLILSRCSHHHDCSRQSTSCSLRRLRGRKLQSRRCPIFDRTRSPAMALLRGLRSRCLQHHHDTRSPGGSAGTGPPFSVWAGTEQMPARTPNGLIALASCAP